jgi:hypothetical protein
MMAGTLVVCATIGLFSIQYFRFGGDIWLICALYLLLVTIGLLIFNALLFCVYTLTTQFG